MNKTWVAVLYDGEGSVILAVDPWGEVLTFTKEVDARRYFTETVKIIGVRFLSLPYNLEEEAS